MVKDLELLIGMTGSDHVLFTNWRYLPEDWIAAEVEVHSGPWRGRLKVEFYGRSVLSTFAEHVKQLHRELRGTAMLSATEPRLDLTLTGNGRGRVVVEGEASDCVSNTTLKFQFSIDQTFLPAIVDQVSAVANKNK